MSSAMRSHLGSRGGVLDSGLRGTEGEPGRRPFWDAISAAVIVSAADAMVALAGAAEAPSEVPVMASTICSAILSATASTFWPAVMSSIACAEL